MKSALLLLTLVLIPAGLQAQSAAQYIARVWMGGTNITYDASGTAIQGATNRVFYDQRGETIRNVSMAFISSSLFGFDWTNYDATVLIYTNDGPSVLTDDSITTSNGYPIFLEHSVTTTTYTSNESRDVTDQTITIPNGQTYEAIITGIADFSTEYSRQFSETRDTNGNLLSWTLYSWTNDPLHSQQFTLSEEGLNDESNPFFIAWNTNTFDSFGNIILSTSQVQFDGVSSSTVTSNSYVIGKKGRVLSSISQTDYNADGIIDSATATTFTYDKFGNVSGQDVKQFAGDGTFQGESLSSSVSDQFGDILYTEIIGLDANGVAAGRTEYGDTYVPRGQAYGNPSAVQHFLDQVRARRNPLSRSDSGVRR